MFKFLLIAFTFVLPTSVIAEIKEVVRFNDVMRQIEAMEYDIRLDEATGNHKSANRSQNLRFTYFTDGFHVETRSFSDMTFSPWEARFSIKGVHRETYAVSPQSLRPPTVNGHQMSFDYSGLRIEYINNTNGMRQNFYLDSKPSGRGHLQIEFETSLRGVTYTIPEQHNEVVLIDHLSGIPTMHYGDLRVWDSKGRMLDARFDSTARGFSLVVDDTDAVYPITVDPLSYTSAYGFQDPTQSGAKFGFSVAFNYNAAIIGAPYFDTATKADAGKVFAFSISPDCATIQSLTPSWTVEGENAYDRLGHAVAGRGNPVGKSLYNRADDIVASAPGYDYGGLNNAGKVYIWTTDGTTKLPTTVTPDWTATGSQASEAFGTTLSIIYNLKSDGYYSLAVGSPSRSRVVVFYGNLNGLTQSPNWSHNGYIASQTGTTTWSFGSSIAMRPNMKIATSDDINGDGYGDLLVGAPNAYDLYGNHCGYVYVFHGSASGLSSTVNQYKKMPNTWGFGFSVAYSEDSNNDGIGDIAVGYPTDGPGKVYVYAGGNGIFNSSPMATLAGEMAGDQFGYSISAAGNPYLGITLVVGAPYSDVPSLGFSNSGAVYIYSSLGFGFASTPDYKVNDLTNSNANLGWSVSTFFLGRVECPSAVYPTWILMGAPGNSGSGYSSTGSSTIWKISY